MRHMQSSRGAGDSQRIGLGSYEAAVGKRLAQLERDRFSLRLWRKDPTLWKRDLQARKTIRNALGWLHVTEKMKENLADLLNFAAEVRDAGFRHAVHMGMGGSSLAPLAFQRISASTRKGLPLTVLDTTDPATLLKIEREIPLTETLFITASKSGTTAENIAFGDYFYAKLKALRGLRAGKNFVTITDQGSPLERRARKQGFLKIFLNDKDIGGRYSALSYFGLVPAGLMGIDLPELLDRTKEMEEACGPSVPVKNNPALVLGAVMGELCRQGRDKLTLLAPESLAPLGMWLEQLIAESTGKEGTGILPVTEETPGDPSSYGEDRLFVHIGFRGEADQVLQERCRALQEAGHPLVTILMEDRGDLGREFFRWEIATAAAGAILRINPFDQPNVQESKDNTNRLLTQARQTGRLTVRSPALIEGPLSLYGTIRAPNAREYLKIFFKQAWPGDYIALLAFLTEMPEITEALQSIRKRLRDALRLATTLGYGPRFLHSTGQFHKGGTNSGLFIQLTADDREDIPIPGTCYTFGTLKSAQALGDLGALRKHRRRAIRIHLGSDPLQGLEALAGVLEEALEGV